MFCRHRSLSIAVLAGLVAFEVHVKPSFGAKGRDEQRYNNVQLVTESPRSRYPVGAPIPIKMTARNDDPGKPFVFETRGTRIREPHAPIALAEPRAAYDVLFVGKLLPEAGEWQECY